MTAARKALAKIGRRGGLESRLPRDGTLADTTAAAQAVQDALHRRLSPVEKLAQVARLARMIDLLSIEGLKRRHPTATDDMIRDIRAELRLGKDLAARVSAARPNDSKG